MARLLPSGLQAEDGVGFGESRHVTLVCVSDFHPCPRFSRSPSSSEVGYEKCALLGAELPGERREKVSMPFTISARRSL